MLSKGWHKLKDRASIHSWKAGVWPSVHTHIFQQLCTFLLCFVFLCFQSHLVKKAQESRRLATGPQDVHKLYTLLLMKSPTNPTTFPCKVFLDSFQEDVERAHADSSFHTRVTISGSLSEHSRVKKTTFNLLSSFFSTSSSYVTNCSINFNTQILQFNTSRHNCFFPDKLRRCCFLQLKES